MASSQDNTGTGDNWDCDLFNYHKNNRNNGGPNRFAKDHTPFESGPNVRLISKPNVKFAKKARRQFIGILILPLQAALSVRRLEQTVLELYPCGLPTIGCKDSNLLICHISLQ